MNNKNLLNSYLPNSPARPIINNVGNAFNSLKNTTTNLANAGGNIAANIGANVANMGANIANASSNMAANMGNGIANLGAIAANTITNNSKSANAVGFPIGLVIIGVIIAGIVAAIYFFYDKIKSFIPDSVRYIFSGGDMTPAMPSAVASAPVTNAPPTNVEPIPAAISSVESILPGKKEVFNVSSNRYTYTDAEPLCRALGAQLATYDQVKAAFDGGADWCNYGWTKGQLALYPTQQETYDKLQLGPEGQRMACGKPGLNGGHFDNPELRFGVNCYGMKPNQSQHDAAKQTEGAPISPGALEFDKKVSQYKTEADNIGIMPFRKDVWSA
jgi:hypothetical protein